jgi:hypothetical protein
MTKKPHPRTVVLSFGGAQSAAIAVLVLQGRLPKPDLIVFADTSREVTETWQYLENIVRPALAEIGLPVHVVGHEYAYYDLNHGKELLLPTFTTRGGAKGKLPTFCSKEWKQRPIRRWLREQGVKACDLWLGISMDEIERMKQEEKKWVNHVYPLIEMIPMQRHQCVSLVENYGWPTPPKSRCWMCPNMGAQAWRQLRDTYPDDFQKAVALEQEIRQSDPHVWLHTAAIPLVDAVELSDMQPSLFDGCDSGYCFT